MSNETKKTFTKLLDNASGTDKLAPPDNIDFLTEQFLKKNKSILLKNTER